MATLAYRGDEPVAGTINFEKGPHLYGRYWGCLDDFQMLHFELCYYRLIERAIERRYTLFEAGAQGEHKLKRGLAPAFTHSAHWIRDPGLGGAIAAFIEREARRGRRGGAHLRTACAVSRDRRRRRRQRRRRVTGAARRVYHRRGSR